VWKKGQTWAGIKTHMGYNQEDYGAECAMLARALESASQRQTMPERVTIFTDAQAAIRRMASEETSPSQQYALQARKHIAALRRARPGVIIEIRWCPAHKGVEGNEKADEWAEVAAEEPDTHGAEWLNCSDRTEARPMPLSRSLAKISEKKMVGSMTMGWGPGLQTEVQGAGKPQAGRHDCWEYQEARFKALPAEDRALPTGQYLHWAKVRPTAQCWWCQCPSQTRDHLFKVCPEWRMQQKILWAEVQKETGRWKSRWKIRDLLADGRCSQAVLDFLSSTDVARLVPPGGERRGGARR